MVYPHSAILFGSKKEWSTDTCNNMDKTWKYYAKWKKSVKTPHIKCFYLYEMSRVGENIKTESRLMVA